jgi:hypothetical protein
LEHLSKIARIGVRDAGVFNFRDGVGSAPNGGSFVLDESLLSQLSFIKEGEFSEKTGEPTVRIIGNAAVISGTLPSKPKVVKTKGIRLADIILVFLNDDKVDSPTEYLRQVCFENTSYLPVYFYAYKAGLSLSQTVQEMKKAVSRSRSKRRVIKRLAENGSLGLQVPTSRTLAAKRKKKYRGQLLQGKVDDDVKGRDLRYCLEVIRCLSSQEVSKSSTYLREFLRLSFNRHYARADGNLADALRKAICWVDEALYASKLKV